MAHRENSQLETFLLSEYGRLYKAFRAAYDKNVDSHKDSETDGQTWVTLPNDKIPRNVKMNYDGESKLLDIRSILYVPDPEGHFIRVDLKIPVGNHDKIIITIKPKEFNISPQLEDPLSFIQNILGELTKVCIENTKRDATDHKKNKRKR